MLLTSIGEGIEDEGDHSNINATMTLLGNDGDIEFSRETNRELNACGLIIKFFSPQNQASSAGNIIASSSSMGEGIRCADLQAELNNIDHLPSVIILGPKKMGQSFFFFTLYNITVLTET